MNLENRLNKLRKENKMTQSELGEKLHVTDKTISSWEQGRTQPSLEMIVKLAQTLSCSVGYLMYGNIDKSDIETELKIEISKNKYDSMIRFLKQNGKFITENHHIDTYYQPNYRKFLNGEETTEWLRIGKRCEKKILNYKNWHEHIYCDEFEVEVDNSENLDKIFKALDIEKIVEVDKKRKTYLYLDKYEIALDYVKELGYFVEIEVKKYSKEPIKEYDDLLKLAKSLDLNLDNIDEWGYPYRLIYEKQVN